MIRFVAPLLLIFVVLGQAVDPSCDYYQDVPMNQEFYVYSPYYPDSYGRGHSCRWRARCPEYTRCRLKCTDVHLPQTVNCAGDSIQISETGNADLQGADKYCGQGQFDILSYDNSLSVGFVSTASSPGGRFLCTLSAHYCQCGWKYTSRIVGGQETGVNEFPMMVGLVDLELRTVYCGATILHERWVITAAHCLSPMQVANVGVLYGEHNIKLNESPVTTLIRSQLFRIHPQYTGTYDYDIGLVMTDVNIVFGPRVGPACMPYKLYEKNFDGLTVTALGWGSQSFGGATSDYLQKVNLQVMDQKTCVNRMGASYVNERTLCTYTPSKDTCQYDSGGPLLHQDPYSGRVYLVGIIVGGEGCATTKPSLNTRLTKYLAWIDQTVQVDLCDM